MKQRPPERISDEVGNAVDLVDLQRRKRLLDVILTVCPEVAGSLAHGDQEAGGGLRCHPVATLPSPEALGRSPLQSTMRSRRFRAAAAVHAVSDSELEAICSGGWSPCIGGHASGAARISPGIRSEARASDTGDCESKGSSSNVTVGNSEVLTEAARLPNNLNSMLGCRRL